MKKTGAFLLLLSIILSGCALNRNEMLIEAEHFDQHGGWVLDQQFTEQMGSAYLLAHGLGKPVEDAETSVTIKQKGIYFIWVRTMNWAPGPWDAPGVFQIAVNDKVHKAKLGTQKGWAWQSAGMEGLEAGTAKIRLIDLTGFDGRCDAILLTTDENYQPPNNPRSLKNWREKMRTKNPELRHKVEKQHFDLVVTGGGIAGCAAALAAAEKGLRVALIHDRPVFGGNASEEIRVHMEGIPAQARHILEKIDTYHWPNGSAESIPDTRVRDSVMQNTPGIILFNPYRAHGVIMKGNRIKSVKAVHLSNGKRVILSAPNFVDCTGDGWIGYWAGAKYRYGRESREEFNENWEKHGELWSPEEPDQRVMGSSLLWNSSPSSDTLPFPEVPWAMDAAGSHAAVAGTWNWEYISDTLHQIEDAEWIRDFMLKAIYGSFYNAIQQEQYADYRLDFVGYLSGKRESRRLEGDYIYTFEDVRECRRFKDEVVEESRPVDVHYQQFLKNPNKPPFLTEALFFHNKTNRYYIPYRSLYSKNIQNLFMAGRCFSCSHIGLGGPRVMYTTGQMGVAVGYAASICEKYNCTPREVYHKHLVELLLLVRGERKSPGSSPG